MATKLDPALRSYVKEGFVNNVPRRRYVFGTERSALRKHVAIAGSIGFLFFGYDQGVLGVLMIPDQQCDL